MVGLFAMENTFTAGQTIKTGPYWRLWWNVPRVEMTWRSTRSEIWKTTCRYILPNIDERKIREDIALRGTWWVVNMFRMFRMGFRAPRWQREQRLRLEDLGEATSGTLRKVVFRFSSAVMRPRCDRRQRAE